MARYEDRSVEDLRKLAGEKDIAGRSSMSKDELVAALRGDTTDTTDTTTDTSTGDTPSSGPIMTDPNNPDDPTNQDYDPNADPPEGMPRGEAPAVARTGTGPFAAPADEAPVAGPNAVPIEQR